MEKFTRFCFVCKKPIANSDFTTNKEVYMPVCLNCHQSEAEKKAVEEYLDSLADGFVCGCI